MRKDLLWFRRAQKRAVGYAALYPVAERPGAGARASGLPPVLRPPAHSGRAKARADAAARRRLVMTVLLVAFALPTLAAVVTGSALAWWAALIMLPLVCIYGAVVVRARRVMAEKEFNVAFLGGTNLVAPGLEDIFSVRPATTEPYVRQPRVNAGMGH